MSFAQEGYFKDHQWQVSNIQESDMGIDDVTTKTVPEQNWDLAIDPRLLQISLSTPGEMSLTQLSDYIEYQKRNHLVPIIYQLSFWQRALAPLASLIMMFLAVPFVFGPLRNMTTSVRLLAGLMVGFAFYFCNQLFPPLSQVLHFPPYLAVMLPLGVFTLIGVFLSGVYLR